jgi:hypothetical protein
MRSTFVALCIAVAACSGAGDYVEIEDPPTNAPTVAYTSQQLDAAAPLAVSEVLRIDGELPYAFSRIEVDAASDGRIVVLDRPSSTLFLFDSVGTLLRRMGGTGDGPGELRDARRVGVVNDTIYVEHGMNQLSRFSVDGAFLGRGRLMQIPTGLYHTAGRLFATRTERGGDYESGSARDTLVVRSIDGATGTSLVVLRMPTGVRYRTGAMAPISAWMVAEPTFAAAPGSRLLLTTPAGTAVEVFDLAGKQVQRLVFQPERREVTDEDVAAQVDRREAVWSVARFPMPREEVTRVLATIREYPRARYYPVVRSVLGVNERELLVERADLSTGSHEWPEAPGPTVWDLVSFDGDVIGRVELPSLFVPRVVHDDVIIGTIQNDDGVPSVLGLRMQRNYTPVAET